MKAKAVYRLIIVFLLGVFATHAQENQFIKGKLVDSKTNDPLVFANIRIKDRALGIITNIDGSFRIPLKYQEYGDIIEISSMGYETKEILITDLSLQKLNILYLDPATMNLDEALVKAKYKRNRNLNAKQIIQRAIDAIPRNYASTSFSTIGYYRDYQYHKNKYINLNEAILEVFDQGFDQLDDSNSETRLFNIGLNNDFQKDSLAQAAYDYNSLKKIISKAHLDAYGGNEFRILRIHDAIRNYNVGSYDFIGALKYDFIKNHFFLRSSDTRIDDEDIYRIKFWVFYPNYRANGTIYISKLDFAIHKLEYSMYDEKKRNKARKKNKHGHKQKVIFDITTEYRKINGKMYLNYISFHNNFILNIDPVFKVINSGVDFSTKPPFFVEYNKKPNVEQALNIENYKIEFKKKRVKLRKVERGERGEGTNSFLLFPKITDKELYEMLEEIWVAQKEDSVMINELLTIKVNNIRDSLGNLVYEYSKKEYLQFREFFVQRVKPESRAPLDNLFMNKRKPIFTNQPITKPKDYNDYWMNTPLYESIE